MSYYWLFLYVCPCLSYACVNFGSSVGEILVCVVGAKLMLCKISTLKFLTFAILRGGVVIRVWNLKHAL